MDKWYTFNFKVHWPENEEPKWWVDVFITDCIVRYVISDNRSKIRIWRIHRRAIRDPSGHKFKLDCFTEQKVAQSIEKAIRQNATYPILKGLLCEDLRVDEGSSEPEALAVDEPWPPELQKGWPQYIHGVSEMFLSLLEEVKSAIPNFPDPAASCRPDIYQIAASYVQLNKKLGHIWQQYGSHAFIHHMNAVFAYVPVVTNPRLYGLVASF